MGIFQKAKILSGAGNLDSCGPKMCGVSVNEGLGGIYHAKAEHKTCRLFKTLMDNNCSFDCKYCANSAGCKKTHASYKPEELANLFMHLNKNLAVEGLFLSSGVSVDADRSTEKMIEAVKLIREKHGFKGYIHFKALPGVSRDKLKQASEYADRMSINLEAPNRSIMTELSSCKEYKTDILRRQAWIKRLGLGGGQTTQIIINQLATDEDVLKMVDWEYENMELNRVYFSAFKPINGTVLENEKEEKASRQNHLYNVDFLLRDYGFKIKEFRTITDDGMLPDEDPKLALAKATITSPIDINEANYEELIRIPGIGPITAKRIIEKKTKLTKFEELKNLGVTIKNAAPFIKIKGKKQMTLNAY